MTPRFSNFSATYTELTSLGGSRCRIFFNNLIVENEILNKNNLEFKTIEYE